LLDDAIATLDANNRRSADCPSAASAQQMTAAKRTADFPYLGPPHDAARFAAPQ